jgi:hypothetical protein
VGVIRAEAARRLEPAAYRVSVPKASLRSAEDVEQYVSDLRARLLEEWSEHRFLII